MDVRCEHSETRRRCAYRSPRRGEHGRPPAALRDTNTSCADAPRGGNSLPSIRKVCHRQCGGTPHAEFRLGMFSPRNGGNRSQPTQARGKPITRTLRIGPPHSDGQRMPLYTTRRPLRESDRPSHSYSNGWKASVWAMVSGGVGGPQSFTLTQVAPGWGTRVLCDGD